MKKNEFVKAVKTILEEMGYKTDEVTMPTKTYLGLAWVHPEGEKAHGVFNLDNAYNAYMSGADLVKIAKDAVKVFSYSVADIIGWTTEELDEMLESFDAAKEYIAINVFDVNKKKDFLKDVVYEQVEDMAIVPCIQLMKKHSGSIGTMYINHDLCKRYGFTEEALIEYAKKSAARLLPPVVIADASETEIPVTSDMDDLSTEMLIMTNEIRTDGASVLFYDGVMELLEEKLHSPYFVIPCNTNEMVVIPVYGSDFSVEYAAATLANSNAFLSVVNPEIVLSDSIYICCEGKLKKVACCDCYK